MLLPNDFNPKEYIELNDDLKHMNEIEAKMHYENEGYKEFRKYKYENIPNDFNPKEYVQYPILFHKYLLKIRNLYDISIDFKIVKENNYIKHSKMFAHLHCYDIDNFNVFYSKYLKKIEEYFSIIITFCIGTTISNINSNYIILKINNYGFDIGAKFVMVNYLNKIGIRYEYILFLHSKSNSNRRKQYFEPLINNLDNFFKLKNTNISAFLPPLILCGDFYELYHRNIPINQEPKWSQNNVLYMNDLITFYDLNKYNLFFPEGNCFILKRELIDMLYSNIEFYGILNTKESFDYSWVRAYYFNKNNQGNFGNDIKLVFKKWEKEKLFGNNLQTNLGHKGLPDGMIEHTFERLIILFSEKLKMNIKIFPHHYYDNNYCNLLTYYINRGIENNIFKQNGYLEYNNFFYTKTIILLAAHTNSDLKINALIHNIKYLQNISDKIIIINPNKFKEKNIEKLVFEKYNNNNNNNNNIEFIYTENTSYICHTKWFDIYNINKSIINEYDNFILTDDSYLIIKELYDFKSLFLPDIEETTIFASNESEFHHTDFLRVYNRIGFKKIMSFYEDGIQNKNNKLFRDMIDNFEIESYKIFDKTNYLFLEKEPVNIHFVEPYCRNYIEKKNYPIIKIKKIQMTNYENYNVDFTINNFLPKVYKLLNIDLYHIDDDDLFNHFMNHGIKEGRKYYINQPTILQDYLNDILKQINFQISLT